MNVFKKSFRFQFSGWRDPAWRTFLKKNWRVPAYWFRYHNPKPWIEQITVGPYRLDVKVSHD